jgi:hypothetical protein
MKVCVPAVAAAFAAAAASAAIAWPGQPTTPAPRPPQADAPPPAWIESHSRSTWLAYGSYCWKTSCVDMIAPTARSDLPSLRVERRTVVRVHLGFTAKSINVTRNGRKVRVNVDSTGRIVFWHAIGGGIVIVSAKGFGDASYVAKLRVV